MRVVSWEFGLLRLLGLLGQILLVLRHTSNNQVIDRNAIVRF